MPKRARLSRAKPAKARRRKTAGAKAAGAHAGRDAFYEAERAATAEILRIISQSGADVQPVFDGILENALRLCQGNVAMLWTFDGARLRYAANYNATAEAVRLFIDHPLELGDWNPTPQAALEKRILHVLDVFAEPRYRPLVPMGTSNRRPPAGTVLAVPLLREGELRGVITIWRYEKRLFTDRQVAMVGSFADQAVIAIENARLFNETREALDQQRASAEVLGAISSSISDTKPVFAKILESCQRLFEGNKVGITLATPDNQVELAAYEGEHREETARMYPMPLSHESGTGSAILEKKVMHFPDVQEGSAPPWVVAGARTIGFASIVFAPMLFEGRGIGAVWVARRAGGAFTDKQIALLKTFADQAVIAIENTRLFNETKEALERQTATAEILKVISSSTTDTQPVFEAIVRSAARLFPMCNASIFMRDGELMRLHAVEGATVDDAVRRELAAIYPIPFNPKVSTSARAMVEREINICLDTEAPDVPEHIRRAGRAGRFRSNTVVPLVRDDEGIGSIVIAHPQAGYRLNEKQLALLRTFADQAVIAIENTRLFNETKEALERQTATGEVLKVISRTQFDLEPVLNIVMDNALDLCEADRVIIFRADAEGRYRPAASRVRDERSGLLELFRDRPILPDSSSATGRAVVERRTIHIPDVRVDAMYGRTDIADAGGYRSILAVPMLREGTPIGVLTISRTGEPRPFTGKQIDLVTTFADQAVIAIENVRLFKEIREKSAQLEVANRHKSEFLANMSHELRTPLNAIIGFSEVLLEKMFGELNEKQADYLKDIHESGRHLLSLINDILDLSKIEAGRMELEVSAFNLPSAISNAMTLVRERAQRHGVQLGAQIDPRLGEVRADERKVKQILLNLLSNAVKFTPQGGRVDVSAKLDSESVDIAVKDTGAGISAEDQAKLFEEFRQVGADAARRAEGTGLGLALAKRFAELHGGAIRVESAPGRGSTFSFSLPLARAARSASSG